MTRNIAPSPKSGPEENITGSRRFATGTIDTISLDGCCHSSASLSLRRFSYPQNDGNSMLDSSSPSQHLLLQLKQQIIAGLGKLNDRDTQLSGVKDLERLAVEMPPEALVLYVSCLCDKDKDSHQKSSARKETVKLFGVLARSHPEAIIIHVNRIVAALVRRFQDPDSGMPEACAETFGTMASHVDLTPAGMEGTTDGETVGDNIATVFLKPLLDAMNVQTKSVQVAAIMCLERVVLSCREPFDDSLPKLVPRFTKHLTRSTFLAKGHLVAAIATLTEVSGDAMGPHLPHLVPLLCDALDSLDWSTRKNTAESLGRLVGCLSAELLRPFKPAVLPGLDSCRSDRVKPVRESASAAILSWRDVPGSNVAKKTTPTPKRGLPDRLRRPSLSEGGRRGSSPGLPFRPAPRCSPLTDPGHTHNRPAAAVTTTSSDLTLRRALNYDGAVAAPSSGVEQQKQASNGEKSPPCLGAAHEVRNVPSVGDVSQNCSQRRHSFGNVVKDNPLFFKKATSEWHIEIAVPRGERIVSTLPDVAPVEEVGVDAGQEIEQNGATGWAGMMGSFVKPQNGAEEGARGRVSEGEGQAKGVAEERDSGGGGAPDILDVESERQEQGIGRRRMLSPTSPGQGRQRQRSTWQAASRGGVLGLGADQWGLFGNRPMYESGGEESELELARLSRPMTGGSEGRSELSYNSKAVVPRLVETGGRLQMAEESGSEMDEVGWARRGLVLPTSYGVTRYDAVSMSSGMEEKGRSGSIGQQLGRVEQQQARMLDMMQAFIASSQDSMEGVEIRLKSLERSMEHLTRPHRHPPPLAHHYAPMDQSANGDGGRRESRGHPPHSPGSARGWQSPRWAEAPKARVEGNEQAGLGSSEEGARWGSGGLSWSSISELVRGGRVGEAYEATVQQGDLPLLLKLMMKTGPVLAELGQETAAEVLPALLNLMATPENVEYVLPWMRQLSEMESGPDGSGPKLTRPMKQKTVEMLRATAEGEGGRNWTGKVAGQLATQLVTAWQTSTGEE